MVVGFINTYGNKCPSPLIVRARIQLCRGVLDSTLCDNVCLAAGRYLSAGTPVSSTNNTDRHDRTETLLKVALSTITLTPIITALSFSGSINYFCIIRLGLRCLTPLSTISQLFRGGQCYWWTKPEKTTDLSQETD